MPQLLKQVRDLKAKAIAELAAAPSVLDDVQSAQALDIMRNVFTGKKPTIFNNKRKAFRMVKWYATDPMRIAKASKQLTAVGLAHDAIVAFPSFASRRGGKKDANDTLILRVPLGFDFRTALGGGPKVKSGDIPKTKRVKSTVGHVKSGNGWNSNFEELLADITNVLNSYKVPRQTVNLVTTAITKIKGGQ